MSRRMPADNLGELLDARAGDAPRVPEHVPPAVRMVLPHHCSCHAAVAPVVEKNAGDATKLHVIDGKVAGRRLFLQRGQCLDLEFTHLQALGEQSCATEGDVEAQGLVGLTLKRCPVKAEHHQEVRP